MHHVFASFALSIAPTLLCENVHISEVAKLEHLLLTNVLNAMYTYYT